MVNVTEQFKKQGGQTDPAVYIQPDNSIKSSIQLLVIVSLSFIPVFVNVWLKDSLKPEIKIIAPENEIQLTEEEEALSKRFGEFWEEREIEKTKKEPIKGKPWIKKR